MYLPSNFRLGSFLDFLNPFLDTLSTFLNFAKFPFFRKLYFSLKFTFENKKKKTFELFFVFFKL